jgi:hypothetical protein
MSCDQVHEANWVDPSRKARESFYGDELIDPVIRPLQIADAAHATKPVLGE